MNNACPSCGAIYSVQTQHIGRKLACKRCGAALSVDADGIRLADDGLAPAPPPIELPTMPMLDADADALSPSRLAGSRPTRSSPLLPRLAGRWEQLRGWLDVALSLTALGVFLVVTCAGLSVVDRARVAQAAAELRVHHGRVPRQEQPAEDDWDRQKAREAAQRELVRLTEAADDVSLAATRSAVWHGYLMFAGLIVLAIGSLGLLRSQRPLLHRIMGSIVLLAEALGAMAMWLWRA